MAKTFSFTELNFHRRSRNRERHNDLSFSPLTVNMSKTFGHFFDSSAEVYFSIMEGTRAKNV